MTCSSFLADDKATIVLDTSVIINLHACARGKEILAAIPNRIIIPQMVIGELEREGRRSDTELAFANGLIDESLAEMMWLDERSFSIFEQLITGSPSLGDGEAATIAISAAERHIPVMDDRKGRVHAASILSAASLPWSLDLFLHPDFRAKLTEVEFSEMLFQAFHKGRMRIDEERCDAIASIIGIPCALQCTSLPNYKTRRKLWLAQQPLAISA
jgi:predicted nucleic acid-binding protein